MIGYVRINRVDSEFNIQLGKPAIRFQASIVYDGIEKVKTEIVMEGVDHTFVDMFKELEKYHTGELIFRP